MIAGISLGLNADNISGRKKIDWLYDLIAGLARIG